MATKERILIVDDNSVERAILRKNLQDFYDVVEAENGQEALEVLKHDEGRFVAMLLDLLMPVMDGYEVLKEVGKLDEYKNFPIVVMTSTFERGIEIEALKLGAWDFVRKPCDQGILLSRLKNVILRSQFTAFQELKYLAEYDMLTGLYNKNFFLAHVRQLIDETEEELVLIRLDIDRFQLINSFFGRKQGDRLLKYVADNLLSKLNVYSDYLCGRMEADVFAVCMPARYIDEVCAKMEDVKDGGKGFDLEFNITYTFGLYLITDKTRDVNYMFDAATMAARRVKGNYLKNYAFYVDEMGEKLAKEQEILTEMKEALEQEQFVVYLQPKYDVKTNKPSGSEALVRWKHPEKGMISPGDFIPVFERNGFITKLDHYMWEKVCQIIRGWIVRKIPILPVSVNISRVNLYDPKLIGFLCDLTEKYQIPRELLQLELTESVYTDNPDIINKTVNTLRERGFTILMDDFGSGYSSLNALKDINIDMLKIDMGFFEESAIPGRGENIIASVMRMAKWLDLPTIAEGVESADQVDFLREIGCEHIQGYFYARPMPVEEYEELIMKDQVFTYTKKEKNFDVNKLWENNPQMQSVFDGMDQAVAILQVDGEDIEILQSNRGYDELFGYGEHEFALYNPIHIVREEFRQQVVETINYVVATRETAECEYQRITKTDQFRWIRMKLKYMDSYDDKTLLLGTMMDVSGQREIEQELENYRSALKGASTEKTILVVDDSEMNRTLLEEMLQGQHKILQAENGQEALHILRQQDYRVDLILLDLVMPVMNGIDFLKSKNEDEKLINIPTVIISADNSVEQQALTMNMGVEDYIIKPFVKEIVEKRVHNALCSHKRLDRFLKGVDENGAEEPGIA